ncbi:hypothetical protein MK805_14880 [Shimazuella sp. AN120528]|nr:hypothetical protein [Shimazuella soli]
MLSHAVDALQENLKTFHPEEKLTDNETFQNALVYVSATVGLPNLPESVEQLNTLLQMVRGIGDSLGTLEGAIAAMLDVIQHERMQNAPKSPVKEAKENWISRILNGDL